MVRWKSKDNLSKLFSFYHMDPNIWTRSSGFSDKCPYGLSHLSHSWMNPVFSLGPWLPEVISMYFWMKIQIVSLSLCVPNSCFLRQCITIFLPLYNVKGSAHRKMWGQVQEILTGDSPCKLAPMNYLYKKKTLHFYHFCPTLRIKEDAHFVSF